ncbi:MAG TPA: beta-propeller fold lactonase family protein [Vicinamibacterales bacterium]|nr:beta-propeller fold lactonase family protein [Vicinamibacterales bacterium]
MTRSRSLSTAAGALALAAAVAGQGWWHGALDAQTAAPTYQVDPLWPKPLPNHWILGSVTGVAVDARNHVWVVHRGQASLNARTEAALNANPPGAEHCCAAAPPILEFDQAGTLVGHWGGPGTGFDWPQTPGGIAVDRDGNIWIAAAGNDPAPAGRGGRGGRGGGRGGGEAAAPPPADAQVLRFSRGGQFQMQIGKAGQVGNATSETSLNRPADVAVDSAAGEVYVADGMAGRRVVVFDAKTGAFKRAWGAYGKPADDTAQIAPYDPAETAPQQFRGVNCVAVSNDGQVYVCDRASNRIQVFKKDGTFVKEMVISKTTRGRGAVWDIAFSNDPQQQFLFVANGQEQKVHILRRDSLEVVSSFGAGGRWPGTFTAVGSVAVDSQGNVYTGETLEGKRVQKFVRGGAR